MATHDGEKHPQPQQSSLRTEPEFLELLRLVKRLPATQRDKLTEILQEDQLNELTTNSGHPLRNASNGNDLSGTAPADDQ